MYNLWWGFGGNTITDVAPQDFVQSYLADAANGNSIVDPALRGTSRSADAGLDPRPSIGSPAWGGVMDTGDDFFTVVTLQRRFW